MILTRLPAIVRGFMLVAVLGSGLFSSHAFAAEPDMDAAKDIVLTGDAVCTRCHEETEGGPSLLIGKTRHGTTADARTPTCTSCHGESTAHVENPEGTDPRPLPQFFDKRDKETTAAEKNQTCLSCHQGGERIHWQGSKHDSSEVACSSCHILHAQKDPVQDRETQASVCVTCHLEKRSEINKISSHPTQEGVVSCSDCHNPHGSAGRALVKKDTVTDTCYTCHMEKRGPFLWNHQPVNEDCTLCHNPHGTPIANLLKSRPPFLCMQCHEATGHRDSPPSLATSGFSANTTGRGCLNCHTNIHGGNNPESNKASRTFRR